MYKMPTCNHTIQMQHVQFGGRSRVGECIDNFHFPTSRFDIIRLGSMIVIPNTVIESFAVFSLRDWMFEI